MEANVTKYSSQYDKMVHAPVSQLVITLGIPTTITMLVTNLYNMVDTRFVGKLGTSASGAVGIVFGFMAVLQAFGFMFGQGAGSMISRSLGNKDETRATRIASTSFFLSLLVGLIIEICSFVFIDSLIYLLGSTPTIHPFAKTYVIYILLSAPFMTSSFVMNNILRFEGKAYLAMIGLLTGAFLNILGDAFFMLVLDMGIAGAGLSTALSQVISFMILLYMFLSGKTQSKLSIKKVTKNLREVREIVETGFPSMARQGLSSISTMILNQQASVYGDAAVAAMSIVSRISMFIFAVGLGMGQGYQPVCGFNYGAKRYSRVKKAFKFTLILSEGMLGCLAIVGLIFSGYAIEIFQKDYKVIEIGTMALRFQCIALFFQPLSVMANMTFQSTGNKLPATFLSLLRSGVYFIPILLILTSLSGLVGVQLAQPIADVLSFLTAIPFVLIFFKKLPQDCS
jgi:putative MATE family efflux protein